MLEAIQLTKKYSEKEVLSDLNLIVEKGEVFCLLGQNGAGKTTTINLFLGLITPTSGKALIDGISVEENSLEANKRMAYIPEVVQLYSNLNGLENLAFFSKLAGHPLSQKELTNLLSKVGLEEKHHKQKMASYSKGMRQKVGIAIALSKRAKAVFMDEPTSGLDPKATSEFTTICKELAKEGTAIFMATHDIFNAVEVGDRIGIMKDGHLVYTDSTSDIGASEVQKLYLKTI